MKIILAPLTTVIVLLSLTINSCTIQKRLYRRGYTITWNHRYKSAHTEHTREGLQSKYDSEEKANDEETQVVEPEQAETPFISEAVSEVVSEDSVAHTAGNPKQEDRPSVIEENETHDSYSNVSVESTPEDDEEEFIEKKPFDKYAKAMWILYLILLGLVVFFSILELISGEGYIFYMLLMIPAGIYFLIPFMIVLGILSFREHRRHPGEFRSKRLTWAAMTMILVIPPIILLIINLNDPETGERRRKPRGRKIELDPFASSMWKIYLVLLILGGLFAISSFASPVVFAGIIAWSYFPVFVAFVAIALLIAMLVLGTRSLREIRKNPETYHNKGLTILAMLLPLIIPLMTLSILAVLVW